MVEVLSKAAAFILIIVIGYLLKKRGGCSDTDYQLLSKIIFNITLPCAVINSFAHFQMDISLIVFVLLGLLFNVLMVGAALLLTRRETLAAKIFYIFSLSGVNIGCFSLPFAQAFLSPFAVVGICMFDVGNAIMCTGLTYAFTASCIGCADGHRDKFSIGSILDKLLHSAPFMISVIMLIVSLLDIHFPKPIYTLTQIVGSANPFLSMLMIGMMFELQLDKKALGYVRELLSVRYGIALAAAGLTVYLQPFSQELNYVLALALVAPSTSVSSILVERLGGNVSLSSFFNSLTIFISVILFTIFFIGIHA